MPDSTNQLKTSPSTPKPLPKQKTPPNFVERMANGKPFDWLKVDPTTAKQK